jgi:hypothetical protein
MAPSQIKKRAPIKPGHVNLTNLFRQGALNFSLGSKGSCGKLFFLASGQKRQSLIFIA